MSSRPGSGDSRRPPGQRRALSLLSTHEAALRVLGESLPLRGPLSLSERWGAVCYVYSSFCDLNP